METSQSSIANTVAAANSSVISTPPIAPVKKACGEHQQNVPCFPCGQKSCDNKNPKPVPCPLFCLGEGFCICIQYYCLDKCNNKCVLCDRCPLGASISPFNQSNCNLFADDWSSTYGLKMFTLNLFIYVALNL